MGPYETTYSKILFKYLFVTSNGFSFSNFTPFVKTSASVRVSISPNIFSPHTRNKQLLERFHQYMIRNFPQHMLIDHIQFLSS